jgi:hypothetical protein
VFLHPSAYLHASDLNVVVLNWWSLARGPNYEVAARNTKEVGSSLANFLDNLIRETQGAVRRGLHIVGFSLGAQVAGIAAGQLKTGKLPRITGTCNPTSPHVHVVMFAMAKNRLRTERGWPFSRQRFESRPTHRLLRLRVLVFLLSHS